MRRLSLPSRTFRVFAHDLTDFAADYLEKLPQLPSYPPNVSGNQTERLFGGDIPLEGIGAAAFDSLPEIFAHSRPASPRFFGYVFGSGEPVGILGEFAASVIFLLVIYGASLFVVALLSKHAPSASELEPLEPFGDGYCAGIGLC